ncbi:MAG: hypothetical protein E7380_03915 [Clostridiales bacterium]|nr:hypothetical protein [Clostridiales bacterium]
MLKKAIKKIACGALAISSVLACVGTMTACETDHPEVEMTIEFNGETYVLEYELNRNVAPATTAHFLWLADNGYYDGLCVHNYEESKLFTGAYSHTKDAEDEDGLVYKSYYEVVKKYGNLKDFPVSVWKEKSKLTPTYTVYGEFGANNFRVENGALNETFGSLTMYYHTKDTSDRVYVKRADSDEGAVSPKDYKYNSATSMFYISLATGETAHNEYCTFAVLNEDSVEILQDLQTAIDEYYDDKDEFTKEHTLLIDADDAYVGDHKNQVTYHVPVKPIVIKKVEVTSF